MRWVWFVVVAGCDFEPNPRVITTIPDAFDAGRECPATYDREFLGQNSRYRLILGALAAWDHSDACRADQPGHTHLIAIDNINELNAAQSAIDNAAGLASDAAWIGGVQLRDQSTPRAGWLSITGGPMLDMWAPGEPNDNGNNVEDNEENFVLLGKGRGAPVDVGGTAPLGALCECDGNPIDGDAAKAITSNRS